jgi:hypothetical protein
LALCAGSSAAGTLNDSWVSAVRESTRRRSPAPAVVRQRCAVKSVWQGWVCSVRATVFAAPRRPAHGGAQRVHADLAELGRGERRAVARVVGRAHGAPVEQVADALGLAAGDLGRQAQRRGAQRGARRVGAHADGPDAGEGDAAVLGAADELLAAGLVDQATGHTGEVVGIRGGPARPRSAAWSWWSRPRRWWP